MPQENSGVSLRAALVMGALIGLGAAAGGYFIGNGFYRARSERYVTVKGLVERDVRADLALWTISYSAAGPDLNTASAKLAQDGRIVVDFARAHGFTADEIELQPTVVNDTWANPYQTSHPAAGQRFIVKGGVRIRSAKVDAVRKASEDSGALVNAGVALGENYPQAPQFFFTHLNDIRPTMLAQATLSARRVAEQFAKDSHSRLGPIRRANQGVFQITGRDSSGESGAGAGDQGSIEKKVRLVTTVDYYLID
jgi:hypothetical protein